MSERIQVRLNQDERYPTYFVVDDHGQSVEVDAETLVRWESVEAAYDAVQREMGELFDAAEAASRRAAAVAAAEKRAAEAQAEVERIQAMSDDELAKRPTRRSEWR